MRFKTSLMVLLLAALFIGQALLAQGNDDNIELIGTVEAINADGSIVVNGQTVTITTAELNVALMVGQTVKVEGTLLADGVIAAREVNQPDNDDLDDDEVEMVGVVESFDGTTLVVGGLAIDVSAAEINGPIVVGQLIKVHASFDDAGNLVAREAGDDDDDDDDNGNVPSPDATPEVRPGDDNDDNDDDDGRREGEFEFSGLVQTIGDGFIVVGGQTISTIGAEIKNQLVVGALVKIHARNENGQLVAREVENRFGDDDDDDDDDSSIGSGDTWTVTYSIRPGDTLSSIAARAGTTVEELARVNNIADIRIVVAGTNLLVPRDPSQYDDDDDDDHSGRGSDDDRDDDNDDSGRGSDDDLNDDNDDNDDDSSGSGSDDNDDNDDDNGGSSSDDDDGSDDSDDDDGGDDDD